MLPTKKASAQVLQLDAWSLRSWRGTKASMRWAWTCSIPIRSRSVQQAQVVNSYGYLTFYC